MKEEFEKDNKNVEEKESVGKKTRKLKKKRKPVVIAAWIGVILGLVFIFTFSSYKILFSPKKASFLTNFVLDITNSKKLLENAEESTLVKAFSDGNGKNVSFNVNLNSKEVSGNTVFNKDFLALKFNNINENYLLVENKNLNQLWDKLGVGDYGFPSEIDLKNNPLKLSGMEKIKVFNFITKSTYNVIDNLEKENFVETKAKQIDINGETKVFDSIEVHLDKSDIFMLQKEMLTAFKKQGMVDLLINKIEDLGTAEAVNKKEIKAEIDKYIAYLDYAKSYFELEDSHDEYYAIYRMYLKGNKVIAREIIEKYTYEGELYEDLVCRLITDENGFYEVKWFTQEEYSNAYYNIISDKITTEDEKQTHEITWAIDGFFVNDSDDETDSEYIPVNTSMNYKLAIEKIDEDLKQMTFSDENSSYGFTIKYNSNNVDAEFIQDGLIVKTNLKKDNTTKKEMIDQGAILLNEKTQEEIMSEFNNISTKITELFAE